MVMIDGVHENIMGNHGANHGTSHGHDIDRWRWNYYGRIG